MMYISVESKKQINARIGKVLKRYGVREQPFNIGNIREDDDDLHIYYEIFIDNCREFPLMYCTRYGLSYSEMDIDSRLTQKTRKKIAKLIKNFSNIESQLYAIIVPYIKGEI